MHPGVDKLVDDGAQAFWHGLGGKAQFFLGATDACEGHDDALQERLGAKGLTH